MLNLRPSKIALALCVVSLALVSSACDRSFEVTWTVDGKAAAEGCEGRGDGVKLVVESRDGAGAEPRRTEVDAACTDGTAMISAGKDAQLLVELLRGEAVVGSSTPLTLGSEVQSPVAVDVAVHTGELAATLTVLGQSCEAAGATRFSVTLLADSGGLEPREIESKEVACEGGAAVYTHSAVKIGSRYFVDATTTIGSDSYEVAGVGQAVRIAQPHTEATVNLRSTERQPGRDAGPIGFVDGGVPGPVDSGDTPDDAGNGDSDAGADDAGDSDDDAGATDAGPADAGNDDAGPSDAGPSDAGPSDAGPSDAGDSDAGDTDAGGDAGPCVPVCAAVNACGDDGCGTSCGTCTLGTCDEGLGICIGA